MTFITKRKCYNKLKTFFLQNDHLNFYMVKKTRKKIYEKKKKKKKKGE